MAILVYLLCGLTSTCCAVLLLREYRRSRSRLLLWMSLAFIGFSCSNILVFIDFILVPDRSFGMARALTAWVSSTLLVLGLIWDAD
jgi:hypothetical protein